MFFGLCPNLPTFLKKVGQRILSLQIQNYNVLSEKTAFFAAMKEDNMVNIAILGFGTVGSGVYEVVTKNKEVITRKAGQEILLNLIHILY